ncbi:unnamed protein product [Discosporangium mesarthrocarpum]
MVEMGNGDPLTPVDRVVRDVVRRAFAVVDERFLSTADHPQCGSTATTVMVLGGRLYSFNVGDSRTIVCRKGGRIHLVTKDHKPNREDESERIKRAGGLVINKRVMGELAVSRAFGDREFKLGVAAVLHEEGLDEHQSGDGATARAREYNKGARTRTPRKGAGMDPGASNPNPNPKTGTRAGGASADIATAAVTGETAGLGERKGVGGNSTSIGRG